MKLHLDEPLKLSHFFGLPGKENQFYKAENVECRNGALIITAQRERAKAESKCEALQRYLSPSERVDSKNPGQMKRNVSKKRYCM